jgi:hypothetical protein
MVQVYAVIGGNDYEGEEGSKFHTLRLFDCKSTAEAYYKELTEFDGYDYAVMEVREVDYTSALATASRLNTKDGITTPW